MSDKTEKTLEERVARELAGRLLGYTEDSADDIDSVKDSLEDALKAAGVRLCRPLKASVFVAPDPDEVSKFLEEPFGNGEPMGCTVDEDDVDEPDGEEDEDAEGVGIEDGLRRMRDMAGAAFIALHHLAGDLHLDRETGYLTRKALKTAGMAHDLYATLDRQLADWED